MQRQAIQVPLNLYTLLLLVEVIGESQHTPLTQPLPNVALADKPELYN